VEQVLTVEELLPPKWRKRYTTGYKEVNPNESVSWSRKFGLILWGGERYDTRASIEKVLHPNEVRLLKNCTFIVWLKIIYQSENEKLRKKTENLLDEVKNFKVADM
jgi:hypothetical protein